MTDDDTERKAREVEEALSGTIHMPKMHSDEHKPWRKSLCGTRHAHYPRRLVDPYKANCAQCVTIWARIKGATS